nr:hypothetical protein [Streptomyces sp. BA2]
MAAGDRAAQVRRRQQAEAECERDAEYAGAVGVEDCGSHATGDQDRGAEGFGEEDA